MCGEIRFMLFLAKESTNCWAFPSAARPIRLVDDEWHKDRRGEKNKTWFKSRRVAYAFAYESKRALFCLVVQKSPSQKQYHNSTFRWKWSHSLSECYSSNGNNGSNGSKSHFQFRTIVQSPLHPICFLFAQITKFAQLCDCPIDATIGFGAIKWYNLYRTSWLISNQ